MTKKKRAGPFGPSVSGVHHPAPYVGPKAVSVSGTQHLAAQMRKHKPRTRVR